MTEFRFHFVRGNNSKTYLRFHLEELPAINLIVSWRTTFTIAKRSFHDFYVNCMN